MPTDKLNILLEKKGLTNACKGCKFHKEWIEWHPYGMGSAGEDMAECICHEDSLCPRLKESDQ